MKKLFNLILVITLLLPLVVIAEDKNIGVNDNSGVITIENAIEGKKYTLYQVFQLESWNEEKGAYTYKITSDSAWYSFVTTGEGKNYVELKASLSANTYIVRWKENADVVAFSKKAIKYAKDNNIDGVSKVANSNKLLFENLNLGYYLVDSTTGSLCILTTTNSEVTVREKNNIPSVKKEVQEDSNNSWGTSNHEDIGKKVNFRTTIDVVVGAENYILNDIMSAGLTLDKTSITVKLADGTAVASTNYAITYGDAVKHGTKDYTTTFTITFNNDYLETLTADQDIVVTYKATLNENAVIYSEANTNDTWLEYGDDNETAIATTNTYTFKFDLVKINVLKEVLTGAEFKLYDAEKGGNEIAVVLVDEENNIYRRAVLGETGVVIKASKATIIGLDANTTYYLEEVKAPEGYNKLTSRVAVALGENNLISKLEQTTDESGETIDMYVEGGVAIENLTGSRLPSTGGMGTVIFMIIGSAMIVGFGVLLVAKLRMSKSSM